MSSTAVRITDGTTTVSLTTSNLYRTRYVPSGSTIDTSYIYSINGGDLEAFHRENVRETYELLIADTETNVRADLSTLQRLLTVQAPQAQKRAPAIPRVYVQVQYGDDADWWQAEILAGGAELTGDFEAQWRCLNGLILRLSWTRRPYWELSTLTQIALTGESTGTPTTGFLSINNTDDSTRGGYADIASTGVLGDLPTPLYVQVQNPTGSTNPIEFMWIVNNTHYSPTLRTAVLEGESADNYGGTNSTVVDVDASNGNVEEIVNTGANLLAEWSLSATELGYLAGARCRVLMRVTFATPAPAFRVRVSDGLRTYGNSDFVQLGIVQDVVDLGTVQLPPFGIGISGTDGIEIQIDVDQASTVRLDNIWILPIEDGFAYYRQTGFQGIVANRTLTDDQDRDQLYLSGGTRENIRNFVRTGRVWLWPGRAQRLHIVTDNEAPKAAAVKVWHRPRRGLL